MKAYQNTVTSSDARSSSSRRTVAAVPKFGRPAASFASSSVHLKMFGSSPKRNSRHSRIRVARRTARGGKPRIRLMWRRAASPASSSCPSKPRAANCSRCQPHSSSTQTYTAARVSGSAVRVATSAASSSASSSTGRTAMANGSPARLVRNRSVWPWS